MGSSHDVRATKCMPAPSPAVWLKQLQVALHESTCLCQAHALQVEQCYRTILMNREPQRQAVS